MTITTEPLALLNEHQYISLTTFRKNGEPKSTPVWFTQKQNCVYVFTELESWKVKRIKNNPQVEVAPCKSNGTLIGAQKLTGTARIMAETEEGTAKKAFKSKYGLMNTLFILLGTARRKKRGYLEISLGNG